MIPQTIVNGSSVFSQHPRRVIPTIGSYVNFYKTNEILLKFRLWTGIRIPIVSTNTHFFIDRDMREKDIIDIVSFDFVSHPTVVELRRNSYFSALGHTSSDQDKLIFPPLDLAAIAALSQNERTLRYIINLPISPNEYNVWKSLFKLFISIKDDESIICGRVLELLTRRQSDTSPISPYWTPMLENGLLSTLIQMFTISKK